MDQRSLVVALLLTISALLCRPSSSKGYLYTYTNLLIDCGSLNPTTYSTPDGLLIKWHTDADFIKSGQNDIVKLLPTNHTDPIMNTLRFFPKRNNNCYKLPLYTQYYKYLFRARFYYGNYDGLSRPPSFRLEIDGKFWANVTASMSEEPVYHELLYILKGEKVTVCLVQTTDGEVPFISSLEASEQLSDSYKFMDNNTALYLHSRINYGANKSVEQTLDVTNECCNRIWRSKDMPDYVNIRSETIRHGYLFSENTPPWPVMAYAMQAHNMTDSIYLTFDFSPQTTVQAYFVLYFMDPVFRFPQNQTSRVEIYINNNKMAVTSVPYFGRYEDVCRVVTLFPVQIAGSAANVTISPAEGSTLAPLLNAMEVYSAIDVSKGAHLFNFSVFFVIVLQFIVILVF